jgi:hypothetical protein
MIGVEKRCVPRGGKISFSEERGGTNIVFGPKYRPLPKDAAIFGLGEWDKKRNTRDNRDQREILETGKPCVRVKEGRLCI